MPYFGTQVVSNRNDSWKVLPYLPRFARLKLGHQVREGLAVNLRGVRPLLAVVWYTSRVRPSTFRVAAAPRSVNNNTTLTHLLATLQTSVFDCYRLCDCDTNTITLFYFWQFQLHSKLHATLREIYPLHPQWQNQTHSGLYRLPKIEKWHKFTLNKEGIHIQMRRERITILFDDNKKSPFQSEVLNVL